MKQERQKKMTNREDLIKQVHAVWNNLEQLKQAQIQFKDIVTHAIVENEIELTKIISELERECDDGK